MKRQGVIFNIHYYVKETLTKILHTIRFLLYDILVKVKSKSISGFPVLGWGEEAMYRWRTKNF